jgi:hypothetical protein
MGEPVLGVTLGIEARGLDRPLQIVEGGHDFSCDLSFPTQARGLRLHRHPLAVVLEVGLGPLGEFEVLVALFLCLGEDGIEVLFDRLSRGWRGGGRGRGRPPRPQSLVLLPDRTRGLGLVGPHLPSSSTTSASTTSSSSAVLPSEESPSAGASD